MFMVDSCWFPSLYQWYLGLHKIEVRFGMKYLYLHWIYFHFKPISPSKAINHTTNNNNMISNNKKCELSLRRLLDSVLVHLHFGPSCLSDVHIRCRRKTDIVEVDLLNVCAFSSWSDDVHDWFMLIPKSLTLTSRPPQMPPWARLHVVGVFLN